MTTWILMWCFANGDECIEQKQYRVPSEDVCYQAMKQEVRRARKEGYKHIITGCMRDEKIVDEKGE